MNSKGDVLSGWRFVALVIGVVAATSAPHVSWWLRTPPGQVALGGTFASLGDFLTYESWMKQAQQGYLLFLNLYDPAPQRRTLFLPYFLALGLAAKALALPNALVLHLARAAASALCLVTARWFCRALLEGGGTQIRAFLMLSLGTGLPALVPEASPVSSMFDSPLQAFAWTPILLGAGSWLSALRTRSRLPVIVAGLCVSVLLLCHPYDAVSLSALVLTTGAVDLVIRRRLGEAVARWLLYALLAAPAAAWTLWAVASNPSLATWAMFPRRTVPWHLLSFGTIAILAIAVLFLAPRRVDPLIVCWVATSILLILLPIPSQRRYIQGLQAPLAILAAQGFDILVLRGFWRTAKYLLACAFPMSIVMLLLDATGLLLPTPRHADARLVEEIRALERLPEGMIFASPGLGQLIAPFAGRQVFVGHPGQTPDIEGKIATYRRFEAGSMDGADLARFGARWVVRLSSAPDRRWIGLAPRSLDLPPGTGVATRLRIYEVVPP